MIIKNFKSVCLLIFLFISISKSQSSSNNEISFIENNINNCFLDTGNRFSSLLTNEIQKFLEKIGDDKESSKELLGFIEGFAFLINKKQRQSLNLVEIRQMKSKFNLLSNKYSQIKGIIEKIESLLDFSSNDVNNFIVEVFNQVKDIVEVISINENRPFYFSENLNQALLYKYKSVLLEEYPKDSCIPYNFIKNFDELSCDLNNENVLFENTNSNFIQITREHLLKERLSIVFWLKTSIDKARNGMNDIFFINTGRNVVSFKQSIDSITKSTINLTLSISGKSYVFKTNSSCNDILIVFVNIDKTYDYYVLSLTIRSTIENKRMSVKVSLPVDYIEFGSFQFPTSSLVSQEFIYLAHFMIACDDVNDDRRIQMEIQLITQITTLDIYSYQSDITNKCLSKPKECSYYEDSTCLICNDKYYLYSGSCYQTCPDGLFGDMTDFSCKPCNEKCELCLDSISCLTCKKGFFLYKSTCLPNCPEYTWSKNSICKECTDNCQVCDSESTCKKCNNSKFLLNGQCVDSCSQGYYQYYNPNECRVCSENCSNCVNESNCLSCNNGYFLLGKVCVKDCIDGTYPSITEKKCIKCQTQCSKCSNNETCSQCNEGYNLSEGQCLSDCPIGSVPNNKYCLKCEKNCDKCLSTNTKICINCDSSTYLKRGNCESDCGENFYIDKSTRECRSCLEKCLKCKDKITCDKCENGFFLYEKSKCEALCPSGYISFNKECVKCDVKSNCKTCSETNTSICLSCDEFKLLYNGKCIDKCPLKTYLVNKNCYDCGSDCESCSNNSSCDSCLKPLFYFNGKCVKECQVGYSSIDSICKECQINNCSDCRNDLNTCYLCQSNKVLFNGKCIEECPKGYFSKNKTCLPCLSNCSSCSSEYSCDECVYPLNLSSEKNSCIVDCPVKTVSIGRKCETCSNNSCLTCSDNRKVCMSCPKDTYLYNGNCLKACPNGTIPDNKSGNCIECKAPCKNCIDSVNTCVDCIENYVLNTDERICLDKCPDGFSNINNICKPCQQLNCLICDTSLQVCSKCNDKTYILNGICYDQCPIGYYIDNDKCSKCSDNCKECFSNTKCRECNSEYSLFQNYCSLSCPEKYVSILGIKGRSCEECSLNCLFCEESNKKICSKCQLGAYLYNNECVSSCPFGFFTNLSNGKCEKCHVDDCGDCSKSITVCERCKDNKYLLNNTCIEKCPESYRTNGNKCEKCIVDNCEVCSQSINKCEKCLNRFFSLQNTCLPSCREGYYVLPNTQICVECNSKCLDCIDNSKCNKCKTGFFLTNTFDCVDVCPSGQVGNSKTGKCVACTEKCEVCSPDDKDLCFKCLYGFLFNGRCIDSCDVGYWSNIILKTCLPCKSTCKSCSNSETCDSCNSPLALFNMNCEDKCPVGTVKINQECVNCKTSTRCKKCSSNDLSECLDCGEFILHEKKCVESCPEGYRQLENRTCEKCIDQCKSCLDNKSCDKCIDSYVLLQNKSCNQSCLEGEIDILSKCESCIERNCSKCDRTRNCLICKNGFYMKKINGVFTCVITCGEGYFLKNNECLACSDENCLKCISENSCQGCKNNLSVLNNKDCVENCGKGMISLNGICSKCENNCLSCNKYNINECLECDDGYVLSNGNCLVNCNEGYVNLNSNPKVCIECEVNCKTCSKINKNLCIICSEGYVLDYDGKCRTTCSDEYTAISNKCSSCLVSGCKNCSSDISTCKECKNSLILSIDSSQCIDECPIGQFLYNNKCKLCDANCIKCDVNGKCITCSIGYFNTSSGKCNSNCQEGEVKLGDNCEKCLVPNCKACDGYDLSKCLECKTGSLLYQNQCLSKCNINTFVLDNKICKDCKENCEKCINEYDCIKCKEGFVLQGSVCNKTCDFGYYPSNGVCEKCNNTKCRRCNSNKVDDCQECYDGFFLKSGLCIENCGDGYFPTISQNNQVCEKCKSFCKICKDSSTCVTCDYNKVLFDSNCIDSCPSGYVSVNGTCLKCKVNSCAVCSSDTDSCIECSVNTYKFKNTCVTQCGNGFHSSPQKECVPCNDLNCLNCSENEKECNDCKDSYYVFNKSCISSCPDGYVANEMDICMKCIDSKCKKCSSSNLNICLECSIGSLFNNNCLDTCPNGYYSLYKKCQSCDFNCDECSNENSCIKCKSTFVLSNNKCKTDCPEKTVALNGKCENCLDSNCINCNDDLKTCNKCGLSYLLHESTCVQKCPIGFFSNGSKCLKCEENCDICNDDKECLECTSEWFLFNKHCNKPCPLFTYQSNKECKYCTDSEKCRICDQSNPNDCLQCNSGILYQKRCINRCPNKTYFSQQLKTCDNCIDNCTQCSNSQSCLKCDAGFVVLDGKCINKCPFGYVQINDLCVKCGKGCETCTDYDINKCLSCQDSLKFLNGICYSSCPFGTFIEKDKNDKEFCKKCNSTCASCQSSSVCLTCQPQFLLYNNQCINTCPEGTVNSNGICVQCSDKNCMKCHENDIGTCLVCKKNSYLLNGKCYSSCPDGYYINEYLSICEQCKSTCKTCINSKECQICSVGYFFIENSKSCDLCIEPSIVIDDTCKSCKVLNCKRCKENDDKSCQVCNSEFVLIEKECFETCPERTYKLGQSCVNCGSNCVSCNKDSCLKCDKGFFIYHGKCVEKCPDNTGLYQNNECIKCMVNNCKSCRSISAAVCDECDQDYILFDNKCVQSCSIGYFKLNNTCHQCSDNCISCNSLNNCVDCQEKYYLKEGKCVNSCGDGFFIFVTSPQQQTIKGECYKCGDNCKECDNQSICSVCNNNYFLSSGICVEKCKFGTFPKEGKCLDCSIGCKSCSSIDNCSECINSDFSVLDNKCVSECPDGMTKVGNYCQKCIDSLCKKCNVNAPEKCNECQSGFLLNYICNSQCPNGYYPNNQSKSCDLCYDRCKTCSEKGLCLTCKDNFYYNKGICETNCSKGTVEINKICEECNINYCEACASSSSSKGFDCTDCDDSHYLYQGKCIDKCPDGYYSSTDNICMKCINNCETCESSSICISCQNNYFFYNKTCTNLCPDGYYSDISSKTCLKCDVSCQSCYGQSNDKCMKCTNGYFKKNSSCIKIDENACDFGQYLDVKALECRLCNLNPNCIECKSIEQCFTCKNNYIASNGKCIPLKPEVPEVKYSLIYGSFLLYTPISYSNYGTSDGTSYSISVTGIPNSSSLSILFWVKDLGITKSVNSPRVSLINYQIDEYLTIYIFRNPIDNKIELELTSSLTESTSSKINLKGPDASAERLFTWTFVEISIIPITFFKYNISISIDDEINEYQIDKDILSFITRLSQISFFNPLTNPSNGVVIANVSISNFKLPASTLTNLKSNLPSEGLDTQVIILNNGFFNQLSYNLSKYQTFSYKSYNDYGIGLGVFIPDSTAFPLKLFSINYPYNEINKNSGIQFVEALSLSVLNNISKTSASLGSIIMSSSILKSNTWYYIYIEIRSSINEVVYTINVKDGFLNEVITESIIVKEDLRRTVKLYYEAVFSFLGNGTQFYNPWVFFGPGKYNPKSIPEITKETNCQIFSTNFICVKCVDLYRIENGVCVDNTINLGESLFNTIESYNLYEKVVNIPSSYVEKDFTISFAYRKQCHSTLNTTYNLLKIGGISLISATNTQGYKSTIIFGNTSIEVDQGNIYYDFMNVVVVFSLSKSTAKVYFRSEDKVYSSEISISINNISNLTFFDGLSKEIHYQAVNGYIYKKSLIEKDINTLIYKKIIKFDPLCKTGDFNTGECKECLFSFNESKTGCKTRLIGLKYLQLYGPNITLESLKLKNSYLKDEIKISLNTENYGLTTRFRLFSVEDIPKKGSGSYAIASISNDCHLEFSTIDPSRELIALKLEVINGNPTLVIKLNNSREALRIVPEGYKFSFGLWHYFLGVIDIQKNVFFYRLSTSDGYISTNTIRLNDFSEKLQNVGRLAIFSGGDYTITGDKYPKGEIYNSYMILNNDKPFEELNSILEFSEKYQLPIIKDVPNCQITVKDYKTNTDICASCSLGFSWSNGGCVKFSMYSTLPSTNKSQDQLSYLYKVYDDFANVSKGKTRIIFDKSSSNQYNLVFSIRTNGAILSETPLNIGKIGTDFNIAIRTDSTNGEYLYLGSNILGPYKNGIFETWKSLLFRFSEKKVTICILDCVIDVIDESQCKTFPINFNYDSGNFFEYDNSNYMTEITGFQVLSLSNIIPTLEVCRKFTCPITCSACKDGICIDSITDKPYIIDLPKSVNSGFANSLLLSSNGLLRVSEYTLIFVSNQPNENTIIFEYRPNIYGTYIQISYLKNLSYKINGSVSGFDINQIIELNSGNPKSKTVFFLTIKQSSITLHIASSLSNMNSVVFNLPKLFGYFTNGYQIPQANVSSLEISINKAIDMNDIKLLIPKYISNLQKACIAEKNKICYECSSQYLLNNNQCVIKENLQFSTTFPTIGNELFNLNPVSLSTLLVQISFIPSSIDGKLFSINDLLQITLINKVIVISFSNSSVSFNFQINTVDRISNISLYINYSKGEILARFNSVNVSNSDSKSGLNISYSLNSLRGMFYNNVSSAISVQVYTNTGPLSDNQFLDLCFNNNQDESFTEEVKLLESDNNKVNLPINSSLISYKITASFKAYDNVEFSLYLPDLENKLITFTSQSINGKIIKINYSYTNVKYEIITNKYLPFLVIRVSYDDTFFSQILLPFKFEYISQINKYVLKNANVSISSKYGKELISYSQIKPINSNIKSKNCAAIYISQINLEETCLKCNDGFFLGNNGVCLSMTVSSLS